jgi:hypothetical protein
MSNLVLQLQHPVTAEQWANVVKHVNQRGLQAVSSHPEEAQEIAEEITTYLKGMTDPERRQFMLDQNDYQHLHQTQSWAYGNQVADTHPCVSLRCNLQNEPRYLVFEPGFRREGNHLVIDMKAGTYHLRPPSAHHCANSKAS